MRKKVFEYNIYKYDELKENIKNEVYEKMKENKINFASCILNREEAVKKQFELSCIYDSRNSFYKKAYVLKTNYNTAILKSYDSIVCVIDNQDNIYINFEIESDLLFSQTTLRHIKEFIKQYSKHAYRFSYKVNDIKDMHNIYIEEV